MSKHNHAAPLSPSGSLRISSDSQVLMLVAFGASCPEPEADLLFLDQGLKPKGLSMAQKLCFG
jgi:hypothetical protein